MESDALVPVAESASCAASTPLYRKLEPDRREIRLLIVEPGSGDDPIVCTFEHVYLTSWKERPQYFTVSYVWGDKKSGGSIILHGQTIDVPPSSEAVLRRMRSQSRRAPLWIDAVCINQNDMEERSSQVAVMHRTYRYTGVNLIWLGEDATGTNDAAQQAITAILNDMKRETNDFKTLSETLFGKPQDDVPFTLSTTPLTINVDWAAFFDFFASPWFGRLWVVQEAALPRASLCVRGQLEIPLEDVLRAAIWVTHKAVSVDGFEGARKGHKLLRFAAMIFNYADQYGRYRYSMSNTDDYRMNLDLLLNDLADFKSQDARDSIYGALGIYGYFMQSYRFPDALLPNYRLSYQKIFPGVAKHILRMNCHLDSFMAIRRWPDEPDDTGLPSWVTRWHRSFEENPDANAGSTGGFQAGEAVKLDIDYLDFLNDSNIVSLKGVTIAKVSERTQECTDKHFRAERGRFLTDFLKRASDLAGADDIHHLGIQHEKVATTLINGNDGYHSFISSSECANLFDDLLAYVFDRKRWPPRMTEIVSTDDSQAANAANYWLAVRNACRGRCLFATNLGHFGVGPSSLAVGDILVVLFGGQCPFVLRPINVEADKYELVGYCWAYDVMNGEATKAWLTSGTPATTYHLV